MKARFLHVADCHLGYKQYNLFERYNDFARAFIHIMQQAVDERVDFVLLAGDLFQKRSIDALTLNQAMTGLERLQQAQIPCIAIEGNHELAYYDDQVSWLEFLSHRKLITLLNPQFVDGIPQLTPYNGRQGAYIDVLPGLRVFGLKYSGASTSRAITAYADALASMDDGQSIEYTILMAHTGVEGMMSGEVGGLSHRVLAQVRPHVNYLALGHIHQPFIVDNWVYNPGSPETCSMMEASWPERGYFLVEVDTEAPSAADEPVDADVKVDANGDAKPLLHSAQLCTNPRRTFLRYSIKTDLYNSPEALYQYCGDYLARKARDDGQSAQNEPVVELQLTGVLPFERSALDTNRLEELVRGAFEPLYVHIRNLSRPADFAVEYDEGVSRTELEQQVLAELLSRDVRFRERSESWTQLALSLKKMVLGDASVESLLQELDAQLAAMDTPAEGAE
ncbi:MAG: exonuclease SbcCD subunit D [Caldilineaceae bacterium]|nr:exonuclease SbcCD subunit D [Caldilineaceae bacterium]